MAKIIVKNTEVTVIRINNEDYISISDMIKAKDGDFFVTSWLRNRNTLECIGIWERVYNPNFNYVEFDIIKSKAGLNSFRVSVKELIEKTNVISLQAKTGRYGGTYAHKDIAFEFAMWISPEFKIYIVKEFQRLKEEEQKALGWSAKRELAKINYHIHTEHCLNFDFQMICLIIMIILHTNQFNPINHSSDSNMENLNAVFINENLSQKERLIKLNQIAIQQMKVLHEVESWKMLK
jgi:hypothetical protein